MFICVLDMYKMINTLAKSVFTDLCSHFSRRHKNEIQFDTAARGERLYTMARRDEDGCQIAGRDTARISEKSEFALALFSSPKSKINYYYGRELRVVEHCSLPWG